MGKAKRRVPKTVLRLPDLDQAKSSVLNSLSSIDAQRGYRHAIEDFFEWYCSEPRLSFSKTVVLRYRIHLESRHLASGEGSPARKHRSSTGHVPARRASSTPHQFDSPTLVAMVAMQCADEVVRGYDERFPKPKPPDVPQLQPKLQYGYKKQTQVWLDTSGRVTRPERRR
jgi:hypothetical protein